ncbi:sugar phosphate isomerase/epimerase [Telmatocola sphagniphila]|uniref:Sugar phosphate isomerase/epimerase n=1 Tax=Telmatocola sphagniphila TaxID=1123043 RepID=A0A8E6ETP7_9BACT|nr:sugar phosphate isomerase/epimerase family protein [Telmatocola sphagniphila]QVL32674.1 sugar phosphate isomerase/epimerase [Telmatocola sphagniphila]
MQSNFNRRDFLKVGGGSALAVGSVGMLSADESKKRKPPRKAMMSATIGYKGSVLEKFKALKEAGFEGVEPMSHMNQEEVVKALEETGLKAASVCCSTHWTKPLSHPDPKVRAQSREGVQRALSDAKRYGATSVLLVPGIVNKDATYDECFKRSVGEIRQLLPYAKEVGVKLAIENVWNDFITKPEQATAFLDEINSDMVGWHFDIGNVIRYGAPEDWIPVLGKRILKLHIKEYGKVKGFNVKLFEGDNKWPAIMKALDAIGYEGWGISEQPGDQSKDAASMKDLANRMDKAFAS